MPIKGCCVARRQRDHVDLGEQCVLLVCVAFLLCLYRHHLNVLLFLSCFLQTKQSQSSHKGSVVHVESKGREKERRRSCGQMDHVAAEPGLR